MKIKVRRSTDDKTKVLDTENVIEQKELSEWLGCATGYVDMFYNKETHWEVKGSEYTFIVKDNE